MNIVRIGIAAGAALVLLACAGGSTDDGQQQPSEETVASTEQAAHTCNFIALCIIGYHWDNHTCRCVKDHGATKCGNTTCSAGDVCCNDSCGICTPPGGICTQQICTPQ